MRGGKSGTPDIQMNPYPLNKVLTLLLTNDIREVYLVLNSRHGNQTAILLGRKSKKAD